LQCDCIKDMHTNLPLVCIHVISFSIWLFLILKNLVS
jgi:hypothetical protein